MYIHKQTENYEQMDHLQTYTWSVERANIVNIKRSTVAGVKVGQVMA